MKARKVEMSKCCKNDAKRNITVLTTGWTTSTMAQVVGDLLPATSTSTRPRDEISETSRHAAIWSDDHLTP